MSHYVALQWCHNDQDGVSNHQPHSCLLDRLFRRRSKKTSQLRVAGLCEGNSPVNSPHKGPVTRKMFPFNDVIMAHKGIDVITHPCPTLNQTLCTYRYDVPWSWNIKWVNSILHFRISFQEYVCSDGFLVLHIEHRYRSILSPLAGPIRIFTGSVLLGTHGPVCLFPRVRSLG